MQATCDKLAELKERYRRVQLDDRSRGWNTEWLLAHRARLPARRGAGDGALGAAAARIARLAPAAGRLRASATTSTTSSTAWRYNGDDAPRIDYGPVKITSRRPARAPTAPPASRPTRARSRRQRMHAPNASRSRCCATARAGRQPGVAELHVPYTDDMSVLQGCSTSRTTSTAPQLPLVVPHGDLRQLRDDGQRQAAAVVPDLPARLLPGPVRVEALAHFPIERDLVVNVERFIASSRASSRT
jgi:hypothetical protein